MVYLAIGFVGIKQSRATRSRTQRKSVKVGQSAQETDDCEGVNNAMQRVINAQDSSPEGIPRGSIYRGG
jgi:hypothetical protein